MSEEHRHGMEEFAEKVGKLDGKMEQIDKRLDILVGLMLDNNKKVDSIRESIPPDHLEVHEVVKRKLIAAEHDAEFWRNMNCYIYAALGTNKRRAITALFIAGALYVMGYTDLAEAVKNKAAAWLGP